MISSFPFPVGSKADLKELEYISFLHQTCLPDLRKDATISSTDVKLYLSSRYGLKLGHNDSLDVVRGLGGVNYLHRNVNIVEETDNDCIVQEKGDEECLLQRSTRYSDNNDSLDAEDDVENGGDQVENTNENIPSGLFDERLDGDSSSNNYDGNIDKGKDEEEDEYLDLIQLMAALLIPVFIKASNTDRTDKKISCIKDSKTNFISEHDHRNSARQSITDNNNKDIQSQKNKEETDQIYDHIVGDVFHIMISSYRHIITSEIATFSFKGQLLASDNFPANNSQIKLNEEVVRQLLLTYGEVSAAANNQLIEEMITAAGGGEGGDDLNFDENAFVRGLTSDILEWKCAIEDNLSTPFHDVFGCEPFDAKRLLNRGFFVNANEKEENEQDNERCSIPHRGGDNLLRFESTSPCIDLVVDSFYSLVFVMVLWIFYIYSSGVYLTFLYLTAFNVFQCSSESFGCEVLNRIWTWATFALILTMGGIVIIAPISISNDPYEIRWNWALLSSSILALYSVLPLIFYESNTVQKSWGLDLTIKIYLVFGCFLLLLVIPKNVVSSLKASQNLPESTERNLFRWCMLSSNLTSSAAIKSAATCKINKILQNALKLHTKKGDMGSLEQFLFDEETYDHCGGLCWTLKELFNNNNLLREHGIWLHSRIFTGFCGQIIAFILLGWFLIYETEESAREADARIDAVLTQPESSAQTIALRYLPPGKIIRTSLYIGGGISAIVGILLILIPIPSTVNTILKLRCGVLPSLHDEHSKKYRQSADTVYHNVGNMVYGLVGAMTLFLIFFGGIIFLFLWNITKRFMMSVLAWALGLTITMTIKTFLIKTCREAQHVAFYRSRARAANLVSLAMESWMLGLAGGTLISRLTQFLLASAFWVGRIDVNYLDDDVNLLGYKFDTVPAHFRKEILAHDAHRHPLIDRLGTMYLMRIRHKRNFCTDAGCAWRRLFVQALMPWLGKYRKQEEKARGEGNDMARSALFSEKAGVQTEE